MGNIFKDQIKRVSQIANDDLLRLGFRIDAVGVEGSAHRTAAGNSSVWFVKGPVRVVVSDEGGVEVYCFKDAQRLVCEWSATFSEFAPLEVLTSMLLKTVGG
jgi:hypothetical protein